MIMKRYDGNMKVILPEIRIKTQNEKKERNCDTMKINTPKPYQVSNCVKIYIP